jgi:hypothetical protein
MAFHLHLISSLQDFIRAAAPGPGQNVSRHRKLGRRPRLHWELRKKGELNACWTRD